MNDLMSVFKETLNEHGMVETIDIVSKNIKLKENNLSDVDKMQIVEIYKFVLSQINTDIELEDAIENKWDEEPLLFTTARMIQVEIMDTHIEFMKDKLSKYDQFQVKGIVDKIMKISGERKVRLINPISTYQLILPSEEDMSINVKKDLEFLILNFFTYSQSLLELTNDNKFSMLHNNNGTLLPFSKDEMSLMCTLRNPEYFEWGDV